MVLAERGRAVAVEPQHLGQRRDAVGPLPVLPGNAVAISVIDPMLLSGGCGRSGAPRVGEQSAVVWKRLYLSPLFASLSTVGMWIGPPNALDWPKPMSSIRTMRRSARPSGGFTSNAAGALALRASSAVSWG